MSKSHRSLVTRRTAQTVLAAAAVVGAASAHAQSTLPTPALINWSGVTGTGNGAFQTLIATTATGNRAVNWDTGGNYLVATGGNQSGATQTSGTVTLGTYLQAGGGALLGDSGAPYYYFGDTAGGGGGGEGAQIGYNGGSATLPLSHPEQVKHIYFFVSDGDGGQNVSFTLNWSNGSTTTFVNQVNDWYSNTNGINSNYNAVAGLGYANGGTWTGNGNRGIYDIAFDVGSSVGYSGGASGTGNYGLTLNSVTFSDTSTKHGCGFLGLSSCGSNFNVVGISTTAVTPAPPAFNVTWIGALMLSGSVWRGRRRRRTPGPRSEAALMTDTR